MIHLTFINAQEQTVGLFINDPESFEGYTLFSKGGMGTYLINNEGLLVQSWTRSPGSPSYLLESGNIFFRIAGCRELTWDDQIVWKYSDPMSHHDVESLPNGNVLLITRERKTYIEAIAAGRNPASIDTVNGLTPLHIIEVEPTGLDSGTVVWEWHVWDHLIQDFDPGKTNFGIVAEHPELADINFPVEPNNKNNPSDWLHTNSIDYNPALDQIIVSLAYNCEIWIIDHSTSTFEAADHTGGNSGKGGDILYRWGNPQAYRRGTGGDKKFFITHDAQWIEPGCPGEGNIIVFHNGNWHNASSIVEIIPPLDGYNYILSPDSAYGPSEPVWTYSAEPPTDFFSGSISGTQRLANGNTLICDGCYGTFFEVTPEGQTVWKYINPVVSDGILAQGDTLPDNIPGRKDNFIFKIRRYAPDYPGFVGKDLTPGGQSSYIFPR